MHRKFIAFILGTAIAVTGLSAVPARADPDPAKVLAGLAVLAIIGAAIQNDRRNDQNNGVVSRRPVYPVHPVHPVRPAPPRFTRLDLPSKCLRSYNVNGQRRNLLGAGCLKNNYAYNGTLPYACQLGYWNGNRNRIGYEPRCLRENGYRFARR